MSLELSRPYVGQDPYCGPIPGWPCLAENLPGAGRSLAAGRSWRPDALGAALKSGGLDRGGLGKGPRRAPGRRAAGGVRFLYHRAGWGSLCLASCSLCLASRRVVFALFNIARVGVRFV